MTITDRSPLPNREPWMFSGSVQRKGGMVGLLSVACERQYEMLELLSTPHRDSGLDVTVDSRQDVSLYVFSNILSERLPTHRL